MRSATEAQTPGVVRLVREMAGVPAFARAPDPFPELMAAAINRQDIAQ